jgi:hypothetical protein
VAVFESAGHGIVIGEDAHFLRWRLDRSLMLIRGEDRFSAGGLEDDLAAIQTLRAIQLSTCKEEPVTVADVTGAI